VRRVPARNIAVLAGTSAVTGLALLWNWLVAVAFVAVALLVLARRSDRGLEPPAVPGGSGWLFGGERLAFRPVSEVLGLEPAEIADRLAVRYGPADRVDMVLWVVASDKTGKPWTLVQDRFGDDLAPITATVVASVAGACDPYLEAQRLSLVETGFALVDVVVIGWGTDSSLDGPRDALLVVGRTSAGAEELGSHTYHGGGRVSHLVELHPDSVARSLGSVDARRWHAAAVRGLVRCMEILYPGTAGLLDELVAEPWRNRRMFRRLDRLTTAPAAEEASEIVPPVVLKVVDGGLVEEVEERPVLVRIDRALSWERAGRAVPTRYA
jgi:hypothetical protein